MPTPFIHFILTKLFFLGAPWNWPVWQAITGVEHGLFPSDDSQLPKPWDRQTANEISAYFDRFDAAATDDAKLQLANSRNNNIPGLLKWRSWVSSNYTKTWGIQSTIVRVLEERNVHPLRIMLAEDPPQLNVWPDAETYTAVVIDAVGYALFGPEALNAHGLLRQNLRGPTKVLVQRTWLNLRASITRSRNRLEKLDAKATSAFKGNSSLSLMSTSSLTVFRSS